MHSWNSIMGAPIAKRTSKMFIKDKVLYVYLTSAPLKQELTMSKPKILDLLERGLGKKIVEDIRFL